MVKDILRQTFLIRQTLQENDDLRLPHGVHALRGETPALPVHICTEGNMHQQSRTAKRMPTFHCRKAALARISFTACIVVLSVTQITSYICYREGKHIQNKSSSIIPSLQLRKSQSITTLSQILGLTPQSRLLAVSVFK